jgi:hypothetical protein
VIQVVLDGIHNMLKMASHDEMEAACTIIEECGGLDNIEALQNHENIDIYRLAFDIIESFFSDMIEDEDPNLIPETTDRGEFQFGANNLGGDFPNDVVTGDESGGGGDNAAAAQQQQPGSSGFQF